VITIIKCEDRIALLYSNLFFSSDDEGGHLIDEWEV